MFSQACVIRSVYGGLYPSMQGEGGVSHHVSPGESLFSRCGLSAHGGVCPGVYTQPQTQTQTQTPLDPEADTPSPEMTIESGGTHPTGMHSCFKQKCASFQDSRFTFYNTRIVLSSNFATQKKEKKLVQRTLS